MKKIIITVQLVAFIFFFSSGYSQLWKQYADSAKMYSDKKNVDSAIVLYLQAKAELEKNADSVETVTYAQMCYSIGELYYKVVEYKKAEPFCKMAKELREKLLGKEHPEYAVASQLLANLYKDEGQYEKAESSYLECKGTAEKIFGKESKFYANVCANLASLYRITGKYEKAEPLYLEAMQIRERVCGKKSTEYALSCNSLGGLYRTLARYRKAEPLYIEAKETIHEVGNQDRYYAMFTENLGILYMQMGEYDKALPLYLEAKDIKAKVVGVEHPEYATNCTNLSGLYLATGEYEKAEALLLEAREIYKRALGSDHVLYAASCNNLGHFYEFLGQTEKAEDLYKEAIQIEQKVVGRDHPDYAKMCMDLASLYTELNEFKKAEPLFLDAKQIAEKTVGKESGEYAASCDDLGSLYTYLSEYQKAEALLLEAKEIRKKVFGEGHPYYAESCNNLAGLYNETGQYQKAESLLTEAKQISEKALGKEHTVTIHSDMSLANICWNTLQVEKANNYYLEAFQSENNQIKKILAFTSENEKQSYLKTISDLYNNYYSFALANRVQLRKNAAYNVSLSHRNLILASSQQLRQSINNSTDTSIKNKYNKWIVARQQLSFWYSKPISERPDYVKDLEDQANTLEKELTRLSSTFKNQQSKNNITWQTIQQNLKPNEAAIEFVDFNFYNGKKYIDSIYYIALLLRKEKPQPQLIKLFEKKQLDSLFNDTDDVSTHYTNNIALYNLAWKPLEKYLIGISKIYFAPAGEFFNISFAALPVNDKQVLSDKYQLVQLNTTANVADKNESFVTTSDKLQLYGGIEYDVDTSALKAVAISYHSSNENHSRSLPDDLERSGTIQYLRGSEQEIEEIRQQANNLNIPVTVLSGINATEESFKALNGKTSPSVLHIATHGFFFPDPKTDKRDSIQRMFESSGKVFKQSDNPLFRSGLLFAGANNAWQGKSINGIEDGIVTAYDVSNMYLPNTKLVVLSACETALGDIQGSEGVYGLQRAFKIAGAQNLVMSLWKVPDAETAEFMQLFYNNMFNHQSISDAFYHAQTEMKNKYRSEPVKWAAWVLVR